MGKPDLSTVLATASMYDPKSENTLLYFGWLRLNDLMEKLKILDYERELLAPMNMQPLTNYYFVYPSNVGEQFFVFQSLCAWLVRLVGRPFEPPQEFHDPSQTIARLMAVLAELDISTDFPTSQLMQGAGLCCAYVLDALATRAMTAKIGRLGRPALRPSADDDTADDVEETHLDAGVQDDSEIVLDRLEQMQSDDEDDVDGGDMPAIGIGAGNVLDLRPSRSSASKTSGEKAVNNAMATVADTENWRLELERVLPQLKVVVKADTRDWRAHWEQMRTLKNNINTHTTDTLTQLSKLRSDITLAFEKISSRENHLNTNLAPLIAQHKTAATECDDIRSALVELEQSKAAMEQQSLRLDDEFLTVKSQMEQRGSAMSDGTPLINIKKAAQRLREELVEMELEIAVLRHSVDQDVIKRNAAYAEWSAASESTDESTGVKAILN